MLNKRFAMLCALLLAACSAGVSDSPPLEGAKMGGPFALTGENGRIVRDGDFAGKYRLIYFGYTYCPDVCPVDVQKLMQGITELEKSAPQVAAKLQPLFVSVDPERDTPAVLREFTTAFHPRLIGLTGTTDDIAKMAKAYGVFSQKQDETQPGTYLVDHSRTTTLYGPKGEPIALIDAQETPAAIAAELQRWVK